MFRPSSIAACTLALLIAAVSGAEAPVAAPLLWSDRGHPTPEATALLQEFGKAAERGLDPVDYPAAQLAGRLAQAHGANADFWSGFDADLSRAGTRFITELHFGRIDPSAVGHNLTVQRAQLDLPSTLARLAAAPDVPAFLDSLEPPFEHFKLLKRELARYRVLAGDPHLTDLPAFMGKSLKPGEAYAGAPQLQALLTALGDMPGAGQPGAGQPGTGQAPRGAAAADGAAAQFLTPPLVAALKNFQRRHGEKPDGVLGAATFRELVRPLSSRVRQIELTMERWRWLPTEFTGAPIIVNIPQFRLFAFDSTTDSEANIRQMDVIVGKAFEATETPVFTADMTYLIFRPYWEVPTSIARKEIVPGARRHPDYLDKHRMQLVRGEGESPTVMPDTPADLDLLAKGVLRVRQLPGPDNSLGLVKFMFPNRYNVYLHSTPARALFSESRRDFSHGCIRVSDPVGLAEYVLRGSPEWTRAKIEDAMNGTSTVTVTLKKPIRVYIVYGTALALENGSMLFFDDIYGHDQRLEAALAARRAEGAPGGEPRGGPAGLRQAPGGAPPER